MKEDDEKTNTCDFEFPRRKQGQSVPEYMAAVSNFTAPRMKNGPSYEEIMDELYDPETGLPR